MFGLSCNFGPTICLLFACQVLLANSVAIRKRRNSLGQTTEDGKSMEENFGLTEIKAHSPCVTVLKHCKRNNQCRETLKDLKTKCAVKRGSCNADMRDLATCANIMDRILEFFDFDQKCSCEQNTRCSRIYETIYENPCFRSVRYLRKVNQMPLVAAGKKSNSNQDSAKQHDEIASSHDLIQELIESIQPTSDDVTVTQAAMTSEIEPSEDIKELDISEDEEPIDFEVEFDTFPMSNEAPSPQELNPKPSHQNKKNSANNSMLLYVIVGVVGLLVIVLLVLGLGLLLYCGLWRKGRSTTKTSTSK